MTYSKQTWADGSQGNTPLSGNRLNHMEDGIEAAHNIVATPGPQGPAGPAGDVGPQGPSGIAGLSYLPLPTGVAATDTAALNAVLARGGRIRLHPDALAPVYTLSAPLVLAPGGNTDVDFGDASFILGGKFNMLQNAKCAPDNTATDVATTAASSVITSPALVAAGAAVGMQVGVVGAGPLGGGGGTTRIWLYGTITAIAGNNITLGGNWQPTQAEVSLTNATGYLYKTRDKNVKVSGGIWDANTQWNVQADRYTAAYNSDLLRFRRCDGLHVRDMQLAIDYGYASSGLGWCFGVALGDCSNIVVERITNKPGSAAPTFVNSSGIIQRCVVRDIFGTSYDDMVAFGTVGANGDDIEGDIGDLLIDGVFASFGGPTQWANKGSNRGVDLYCGKGSNAQQRVIWNAEVRSVKGPYNNWPVSIVSYPSNAAGSANVIVELQDITGYKIGGGPVIWVGGADGTAGGLNATGGAVVGTITGPNTGRELAYAEITANAAALGPAAADVPGLSINVVAPPSGNIILEAFMYAIGGASGASTVLGYITDGANVVKTQMFGGSLAAAAYSPVINGKVRITKLVAGTTYTFKVRVSGTAAQGTLTVPAATTFPAFIRAIAD